MYLRVALVVAAIALVYWYMVRGQPPARRRATLRNTALLLLGGLLLLLAVTGRAHWLFGLLGGLLPFARSLALRLLQMKLFQWLGSATLSGAPGAFGGARPRPAQRSTVNTATLRMELDHDSGDLDGEVLRGRFAGQRLSALAFPQLLELLRACRADDPPAAALLESYLERMHAEAWQADAAEDHERGAEVAPAASMSAAEAREILGVAADADADAIRAAHRRLIQRLHPDRGGSSYLAAQINRAKDLLLGD
ncbi:MAG TPA: molecular chaperone DnaJ [Gammaproteobacteria bacterium]